MPYIHQAALPYAAAIASTYRSIRKAFHKVENIMKLSFAPTQLRPTLQQLAVGETLLHNVSHSPMLFASPLDDEQNFLAAVSASQRCCHFCLLLPDQQGHESMQCPLGLRMRRTRRIDQTHLVLTSDSLFFLRLSTEAHVSGQARRAAVHCIQATNELTPSTKTLMCSWKCRASQHDI